MPHRRRGPGRRRCVAAMAVLAAIAATACAPRVRRPVPGEKVVIHRVGPDETVADVAADYYGEPKRAREIARFNHVRVDEVNPGDTLLVPLTPEEFAVVLRREQARVPYNRGLERVRAGAWLDAITAFRRATELDPWFADAWYNLGVTLGRMKRWVRAIEPLREAVRLRPHASRYRHALGTAWYHLQRYDRARRAFERAVRDDPRNARAWFSLASTWEKLGRLDRARRAWRRYLELDADSEWAARARRHLERLDARP